MIIIEECPILNSNDNKLLIVPKKPEIDYQFIDVDLLWLADFILQEDE